jgi:hypothetical protein
MMLLMVVVLTQSMSSNGIGVSLLVLTAYSGKAQPAYCAPQCFKTTIHGQATVSAMHADVRLLR